MIFDDNQFKALHGKELNMKNRFNHKDHIDPKEKWFLLGLCALCGKNVSVFAGGQSGRGAADKILTCLTALAFSSTSSRCVAVALGHG